MVCSLFVSVVETNEGTIVAIVTIEVFKFCFLNFVRKANQVFLVFFRYNLGKVLESLGEYETASDAMDTALTIEISSPILPFNSVPLVFD